MFILVDFEVDNIGERLKGIKDTKSINHLSIISHFFFTFIHNADLEDKHDSLQTFLEDFNIGERLEGISDILVYV